MIVFIKTPDNSIATNVELGEPEIDFSKMVMFIKLNAFNTAGDKVYSWILEEKIKSFPIPSIEDQWAIAMPLINQLQEAQ